MAGCWNEMIFHVPSNPNHSMILNMHRGKDNACLPIPVAALYACLTWLGMTEASEAFLLPGAPNFTDLFGSISSTLMGCKRVKRLLLIQGIYKSDGIKLTQRKYTEHAAHIYYTGL